MNTDYLNTISKAASGATATKAVIDNANANDFYSALDTAVPQWQRIRTRMGTAANTLSKEASSIIKGDLPEGLSKELDILASQRNRAQGRYGPAADLSKVNMRASERLRLTTKVGPELMARSQQLMQAATSMTPKQMDFASAYGPALQTMTKTDMMEMQDDHVSRRQDLAENVAERTGRMMQNQFDERVHVNRWTENWNETDPTRSNEKWLTERMKTLFEKQMTMTSTGKNTDASLNELIQGLMGQLGA